MQPQCGPSFFKTMVNSSKTLVIPPEFVIYLQKDFSDTAILVGPSGDIWTVEVKNSKGVIKLKKGWQKFCEENFIGPVDVLLFEYEECMRFHVKIFVPSGMKRMSQAQEPSILMAEKTTCGVSSKLSKKKKNSGHSSTSSGDSSDPKNPCFETEVKAIKGNKLFVPVLFLRENNIELAKKLTLADPVGRVLIGKFGVWGDGRVYVTGWKTIVNCNKLQIGDKCLIELVMPLDTSAGRICSHLKVHITERGV